MAEQTEQLQIQGLSAISCETLANIVEDGGDNWTKEEKQDAFDELARRSAEMRR